MVHLYRKYKDWKLKRYIKKFGSKNNGYFNTFDVLWFSKHQYRLIWLCNHPILKYWFRWILRIHNDINFKERICVLQPNNYKIIIGIDENQIKIKSDFRTHQKFSKRIYFSFKYIWWIAHFWDWLIADRFVPELSFGFLTLTVSPDPDPETDTVDGVVGQTGVNVTFTTLVNGVGSAASSNVTWDRLWEVYTDVDTDKFRLLRRSIFLFNTSTLTSSATIIDGKVSLYINWNAGGLDHDDSHIVSSNPATNTTLVNGDFDSLGSTSYSSMTGPLSTGQYVDWELDQNGLDNIGKTTVSKFGGLCSWDLNNNFGGTWVSDNWSGAKYSSADTTGTDEDPKLVVTYTYWTHEFLGETGFAKAIDVDNVDIKSIIGVE